METKRTFKRMVRDFESSQQPKDSYYNAETVRLIGKNGDYFVVQDMQGNKLSFRLTNENYFPTCLAKAGDSIIVFACNEFGNQDTNGEIGVATYNHVNGTATYVPYYNHQDLNFNAKFQIEAIYYPETQGIRRSYWVDWHNTIRSFNVANPIFTTYISTGSLVVGQQYMVVQGDITHNAVDYGPQQAVNGTVFTAANVNYTDNTGTSLVIEYYNINKINVIPMKSTGTIDLRIIDAGGALKGGEYLYSYQLYTIDGTESVWSYVTEGIQIPSFFFPNTSRSRRYQEMQGESSANNTTKAVGLTISGIDTNFDKIRICAIHATTEVAADPPIIWFDGDITGATMDFTHYGNENLQTITFDDLLLAYPAFKRVGTLASVKRRLYIGRVELFEDGIYDMSGVSMTPIEYKIPCDIEGRKNNTDAGFADYTQGGIFGHWAMPPSGVTSGSILTDQWYIVESDFITYNAVVYNPGDTFQGVATVHAFTPNSGASVVQPIIRLRQYGTTYRNIKILNDYLDYRGSAVSFYLQSLMRGEVYRWALIAYDFIGNPLYAHWMKDKEMPQIYATTDPETGNPLGFNPRLSEEYFQDFGTAGSGQPINGMSLRALGLEVSGIDFQLIADAFDCTVAELPNFISGFSIVRAKRDSQIIGQGMLVATASDGATRVYPAACMHETTEDQSWVTNGRRLNVYTLHSPDTLFRSYVPQDGDKLKIVDYLEDLYSELALEGTLHTNNYHYYLKHVASAAVPTGFPAKGVENRINASESAPMVVGANDQSFGTAGLLYNAYVALTNPSTIDPGARREATGGSTFVLTTVDGEPGIHANGFAAHYIAVTNATNRKALVNIVRPKGNLYGGSSDAAKANTIYHFVGHYQALDAAFMTYLAGNGNVADNIHVFGGDTFVNLFDNGRLLKDVNNTDPQYSQSEVFPVESSINIARRQGRTFARDRHFETGNPNPNGLEYPDQVEQYVYNEAYSYEEGNVTFGALPDDFIRSGLYDKRVYVSQQKFDGERFDNFKKFLVNDYMDLEGQAGYLTNLRSKKDILYFWQYYAFGYIPAEEKAQIPAGLGTPIVLGTGGVLERWDQRGSYYGNQHQFGLAETDEFFMWVDMRKKMLCVSSGDGGVMKLSVQEGIHSYISELFFSIITNDNPILDNGICIAFNHKYQEVWIVFRGPYEGSPGKSDNGFLLVYSLLSKGFVSKTSILPGLMLSYQDNILSTALYHPTSIGSSTLYMVGDRVLQNNSIYICIVQYTSAASPVQPSTDLQHWQKVYEKGDVFVENLGLLAKFYGWCRDTVIEINEPGEEDSENKVFLNMRAHCNGNFFDTAVYSNAEQSATDLNLRSNENYENIDQSWLWSVPLDQNIKATESRFVDHFIHVKLRKLNHSSNITQALDRPVKLVSLITEYYKAE